MGQNKAIGGMCFLYFLPGFESGYLVLYVIRVGFKITEGDLCWENTFGQIYHPIQELIPATWPVPVLSMVASDAQMEVFLVKFMEPTLLRTCISEPSNFIRFDLFW